MKAGKIKSIKKLEYEPRFEWRFTEDEKENFRITFKRKGITKGVENFIDRVELICHGERLLRKQRKPQEIDREARKILRNLKDVLQTIKMMWRDPKKLSRYLRIPNMNDIQNWETAAFNRTLQEKSVNVILPLQDLIRTIESRPKVKMDRRGSPGNVTELEKNVLNTFKETIGQPRTKVLLSDILKIIREAVNRPHSDITRTVKTLR